MVQPRATPPLVPPEPAGGGGGCSAGRVGRERDGVGLGEVGGAADGAPLAVSCPGWRAVAATRSPAWSAARARARPKPREEPAATAVLPPFTAALALELAPVRVNLIAARFVDTSLSASLLGDRLEERCNELRERHPAGRGHALRQRRGAPRTRRGPHGQVRRSGQQGERARLHRHAASAAGSTRRSPGRSWTPSSWAPNWPRASSGARAAMVRSGQRDEDEGTAAGPSTRAGRVPARMRRPDPGNG